MPNITLYGTPISTYVRTTRLLLTGAGIDYTLEDIDIFDGSNNTDEYRQKHPFGKVPTLEVEGEIIYETDAITYYLDEKFANNKFSPADVLDKARMYQIMSVVNSYLYAPAVGVLTTQNIVVPKQGGRPDQKAIEGAILPAQNALEAIEKLFKGNPYLLGSELSIADLYLIPIFVYISQTPQFDAVTTQTLKLSAWWKNVQALDIVKEICS